MPFALPIHYYLLGGPAFSPLVYLCFDCCRYVIFLETEAIIRRNSTSIRHDDVHGEEDDEALLRGRRWRDSVLLQNYLLVLDGRRAALVVDLLIGQTVQCRAWSILH
jgi:hypothetical protein